MRVVEADTNAERVAHDLLSQLESAAEVADVFFEGRLVRWRLFGSGNPLVLLHGGHGNWLHWARNILPLSESHRLLVADMPGYGDSDSPNSVRISQTGVDPLVAALLFSLERLLPDGQPFDLAGFSFGGLVAATLASSCERVRKICLVGPAGHGMLRRQTAELLDWRDARDSLTRADAFRQNLSSFMLHELAPDDDVALQIYVRACQAARFSSKRISRRGGLVDLVESIRCPLLALWGEHDVTANPPEVGEALRADRADRDWCLVSDAGHWVQYERPRAVNQLLLTWLRSP